MDAASDVFKHYNKVQCGTKPTTGMTADSVALQKEGGGDYGIRLKGRVGEKKQWEFRIKEERKET